MVTLIDIIKKLVPIKNEKNKIKVEDKIKNYICENFQITNFLYNDNLDQIISCIIYSKIESHLLENINFEIINLIQKPNEISYSEISLNRYYYDSKIINLIKNKFINLLDDDKFIFPFNKKKLISLITLNEYNNELIIYLATILNINIMIYYEDINIFKIYYPEETLNINKNIILLKYLEDFYTNKYSYQLLFDQKLFFNFNDVKIKYFFDEFVNNIYSIGLNDNKKLIFSNETNNSNTILYESEYNLSEDKIEDLYDVYNEDIYYSKINIPKSLYADYIKYILKTYKFKDYRIFKYYK